MSTNPAAFTGLATLSLLGFNPTLPGATPNATLNVFGAVVNYGPQAGFTGIAVYAGTIVSSGLGAETVTLQVVVTYSDNSQTTLASWTTATTNATTAISAGNLIALVGAGFNGKTIKNFALSVASSINASTASIVLHFDGINLP